MFARCEHDETAVCSLLIIGIANIEIATRYRYAFTLQQVKVEKTVERRVLSFGFFFALLYSLQPSSKDDKIINGGRKCLQRWS